MINVGVWAPQCWKIRVVMFGAWLHCSAAGKITVGELPWNFIYIIVFYITITLRKISRIFVFIICFSVGYIKEQPWCLITVQVYFFLHYIKKATSRFSTYLILFLARNFLYMHSFYSTRHYIHKNNLDIKCAYIFFSILRSRWSHIV